jgi:uncharacterized phiE125 gp8 family phage protein
MRLLIDLPVSQLVTPPAVEPLTLDEAKLRAAVSWPPDDPRNPMMEKFIRAARSQVEQDTGLALLTQTRDVWTDTLPPLLMLPAQCVPTQSVVSVSWYDSAGVAHLLPADQYVLDPLRGAVLFAGNGGATDVRALRGWATRVIAGWPTPDDLPPMLLQACGLLTAHLATSGRDLTTSELANAITPYGYEDNVAPYRPVLVP